MKNHVEIEGYVTNRIWQWQEPDRSMPDTLFRLACYPNGNGTRPVDEARPRPFYVTVRVQGSVLDGIPVGVQPEQRLLVTGRLVSRDYMHSLADFLARVRDVPELTLPEGFDPERAVELRSLNEVVADSLRVVDDQVSGGNENGNGKLSRRQRRHERQQAAEALARLGALTTGGNTATDGNATRSPDSGTLPIKGVSGSTGLAETISTAATPLTPEMAMAA
jgi:hypothetical protein